MESNRSVSAETTQTIHNEYGDVFTGIRCFKGTFSLPVKDDINPYQTSPRHIVYAVQESLKPGK